MRIAVIADDLTGALDTGVQFAIRGIPAKVIVNGQKWENCENGGVQAMILDAETRCMRGEAAYHVVREIAQEACLDGVDYIYKKTDSVQRGNIGYELQAVLDGTGQQVIHYAPAFPQMGRITRDGIYYVHEIPVADTVFGQDLYEPVRHSYIPDIIHEQSTVEVSLIKAAEEEPMTERGICLYDASNPEELKEIAEKIVAERNDREVTLLAGCAGFALSLTEVLGTAGAETAEFTGQDKLLVVAGSMNPVTERQMNYAVSRGFVHICLQREQLQRQYWESAESRIVLERFRKLYENNTRIILDTNDVSFCREDMKTVSLEEKDRLRKNVTESLGIVVETLLKDMSRTTLMVVGGDTLMGLMNQMKIRELVPVCELFPGVVYTRFQKEGRTVSMLSKSGGFGEPDLLVKLAEMVL